MQEPPTQGYQSNSLISLELPNAQQEERLPALLSFGSIYNSTLWNPSQKGSMNLSSLLDTPLMIYGASRALFQAMHDYSLDGKGSYQATFVPTVAYLEGLKMVSVELPRHKGSHFPIGTDARLLYRRFFEDSRCTNSILLHPIKVREPYWPLQEREHGYLSEVI